MKIVSVLTACGPNRAVRRRTLVGKRLQPFSEVEYHLPREVAAVIARCADDVVTVVVPELRGDLGPLASPVRECPGDEHPIDTRVGIQVELFRAAVGKGVMEVQLLPVVTHPHAVVYIVAEGHLLLPRRFGHLRRKRSSAQYWSNVSVSSTFIAYTR